MTASMCRICSRSPACARSSRLRTEPASVNIGGQVKRVTGDGAPTYTAIYEIDSPHVLTSAAWAAAVEMGRWPKEVRPFTSNRRHIVRKVM